MRPQDYQRRILLAVTGLSPQVVTETIYALTLGREELENRFLPTEVHLVTTEKGAEHARLNLLSEAPGHFHQLCRDYADHGLTEIQFEPENIHQITRKDGSALNDIRDSSDNDIAADFITRLIRELTGDETSALHISIAGGRKTMGYYLGYALSLYGREQDRLSHVLVSEPFENNRDFYYPTPYESVVHVSEKGVDVAHDCRQAEIELAEIPFVRLRQGLPSALLKGDASFTEVVNEAQRSLPAISIVIDTTAKKLEIAGRQVMLPSAIFAFYWMLANKAASGQRGVHWTQDGIADEYLVLYGMLAGTDSGHYERTEDRLRHGIMQDFIEQKKSKANSLLRRILGERLAQDYLVYQTEIIPGSTAHLIGLSIEAKDITIC